MKFWQSTAWVEADQLPEIAKMCEEVGFHGVLSGDHIFLTKKLNTEYPYTKDGKMNYEPDYPFPDLWTTTAAMAAVTKTLLFSSSIYILPLRSPVEVAKIVGTTAIISNNRVSLGFGVGWNKDEFDVMGVDFHTRGKRTEEMIEVMRKIWSGGVVSHDGQFFKFKDIFMAPAPTKQIPLYYGGTSAPALKRAATMCDGFIGPGNTMEQITELMKELKRLRREAGREHLPFETLFTVRPLTPAPTLDDFKRLEDMGVSGVFLPPFHASGVDRGVTKSLGLFSTIQEKRRVLEETAETILRKFN